MSKMGFKKTVGIGLVGFFMVLTQSQAHEIDGHRLWNAVQKRLSELHAQLANVSSVSQKVEFKEQEQLLNVILNVAKKHAATSGAEPLADAEMKYGIEEAKRMLTEMKTRLAAIHSEAQDTSSLELQLEDLLRTNASQNVATN